MTIYFADLLFPLSIYFLYSASANPVNQKFLVVAERILRLGAAPMWQGTHNLRVMT